MPLYRVWYVRHTHRHGGEKKDGSVVIRYRKKRMVKDVEAENQMIAWNSVNSTPKESGDPYNTVWGVCPATEHATVASLDKMFHAEEQPLFSEEELKKCAR